MNDKILIDRAVVEQALISLEITAPIGLSIDSHKRFYSARNALRVALEQEGEEDNPATCWRCGSEDSGTSCGISDCGWITGEPEQEPVAWMHRHIDGNVITHRPADFDKHPDRWTPLYTHPLAAPEQDPVAWIEKKKKAFGMGACKNIFDLADGKHYLYTEPQRREWVGLTDVERDRIVAQMPPGSGLAYGVARAIEAALKEKNG